MSKTLTYWLGILGVLFFIVAAILGGFQFENYSHLHQFISESYATGTPYGEQLRFFGYVPSGIMIALFALFAPRFLPASKSVKIVFWAVAIFYGLGTVMVGLFPCDQGCNKELINPSISQIIHNLSAALTYLLVPVALIIIGVKAKSWLDEKAYATTTVICGVVALVFAFLLFGNPNGNYIGLYQRLAEGSILFWILRTAILIKNSRAKIS